MAETAPRTLILACGALAKELLAIVELNDLDNLTIECLPASYHMRPALIVPELRRRLDRDESTGYDQIYIGYADCGTVGELDALIAERDDLDRLPGAHCYEFFAGQTEFAAMHDADPTVFYLTDYLARHFDRFVWAGLGLEDHPQLLGDYFGNYTTVVYLAQTNNPELDRYAEAAAERLGLAYRRVFTGYGELETNLVSIGPPTRRST